MVNVLAAIQLPVFYCKIYGIYFTVRTDLNIHVSKECCENFRNLNKLKTYTCQYFPQRGSGRARLHPAIRQYKMCLHSYH